MTDDAPITPPPKFRWSEEKADLCRQLWSEGLSASQIASEIGATSRNSVLSKIHRSGWAGPNSWGANVANKAPRPRGVRKPGLNKPGPRAAKVVARVPPGEALPEATPGALTSYAEGGPKPLLELRAQDCRWPLGDPRDRDAFGFCAAPRANDHDPYCHVHNRVAFDPRSRKDRP